MTPRVPLTADGTPMVRSKEYNGWADPECSECGGTGIGGGFLTCDECFLSSEDVLSDADFCPPRVEAM